MTPPANGEGQAAQLTYEKLRDAVAGGYANRSRAQS